MHLRRFAVLLTAMAAVAATVSVPQNAARAAPAGDLKTDLDAILSDPRLNGVKVGVLVRHAGTGADLYARGAGQPLLPASNRKIESSAAAFGILGPGYRFHTSVHGVRTGAAIRGDLYLKGTGDPTMRAGEYDRLAAAIRARGITRVRGRLIADATWFDAKLRPSGWDPEDFQYAYAAPVSALTLSPNDDFSAGTVNVMVNPRTAGQPVSVALSPRTSAVKVDNRAVTGPAESSSTLAINNQNGKVVVTGSHPAGGARYEALRSVQNPALYAADVFRSALRRHGVTVAGVTRQGRTPAAAARLANRDSLPLSRLATPFLKLSNNIAAETLVKAIGRKVRGRGTWEAGLPAVTAYLRTLGVRTDQIKLTDGSGLARSNVARPRQLSIVLKAARTKPWFATWYNALPIAGRPAPLVGGTLRNRMANTAAAGNVHAKTGSLTGVSALSGYVTDPQRRPLIFSIMINGDTGTLNPKALEDRIAVRLASGSDPGTLVSTTTRSLECSWIGAC